MVNLKLPLSSVNVPTVPPLTVIDTAEIASRDLAFFTLPDTVVVCCAMDDAQIIDPIATDRQLL
ncbi:MAG: hypothetical protein NVSMB63_09400 [Sediminibacterium sp.]